MPIFFQNVVWSQIRAAAPSASADPRLDSPPQEPDVLTYFYASRLERRRPMMYVRPLPIHHRFPRYLLPSSKNGFLIDFLHMSRMPLISPRGTSNELEDVDGERNKFEVGAQSGNVEIGQEAWLLVVADLPRFEVVGIRVTSAHSQAKTAVASSNSRASVDGSSSHASGEDGPSSYASGMDGYSDANSDSLNNVSRYRSKTSILNSQSLSSSLMSRIVDRLTLNSSQRHLSS